MNITKEQAAAVFTEWQRQYREAPDKFMEDWQIAAQTTDEYGDGAARCFFRIAAELDAKG